MALLLKKNNLRSTIYGKTATSKGDSKSHSTVLNTHTLFYLIMSCLEHCGQLSLSCAISCPHTLACT